MHADLSMGEGQGSKRFRSYLFQPNAIILLSGFSPYHLSYTYYMSSLYEALQQMTAAPTEKSSEHQQFETLQGESLFSAFSHIALGTQVSTL